MTDSAIQFSVQPNPGVVFSIAHEDADLLVINKPAGLVVQPGKGHKSDALLNGLFARYGKLLHNLGARRDFGLLHRLDRDTSGLVVVAKMPSAYDQLRRDFEDRKIDKEYLALVRGVPKPKQGVIQARLKEITEPGEGRAAAYTSKKKVIISRQGQEAISAYQVVASAGDASLVRVRIKTGRLHQIRAHMLFLGTPVLGDEMYGLGGARRGGARVGDAPRLCLHAVHLGFKHPTTGRWLHVEAPLPADLANYARKLRLAVPAADVPGAVIDAGAANGAGAVSAGRAKGQKKVPG